MSMLERGFKSWSERLSAGIRRELSVAPHDPLDPRSLANYLEVTLWTPSDVRGIPEEILAQLLDKDPRGWSAVTQTVGDRTVVIYNPRHSRGRQASNITHELAHIILDHEPGKIMFSHDGSIVMRTFDAKQEDEAGWLSGCLLLPRLALLSALRRGESSEDISKAYGVSEMLVRYRISLCGVAAQVRAADRRQRRP